MTEFRLKFADLKLHICSDQPLRLDASMAPFQYGVDEPADVRIRFSWDWDDALLPSSGFLGRNDVCEFYADGPRRCCLCKDTRDRVFSSTLYDDAMTDFLCVFSDAPDPTVPMGLDCCLRMLPLSDIWTHYGILMLHSSQVVSRGKGIVFAAPSGTGKTTQAGLWHDHRDARIVCNDRTLLRKAGDTWYTYGYFADGSEPVRSTEKNPLAALVLLEQAPESHAVPLGIARAAAGLMPLLLLDSCNGRQFAQAQELLLDLLARHSVFLLRATPDEAAVAELERILLERKLIENAEDI